MKPIKTGEKSNIADLWRKEYQAAGIPSSYRKEPSSVVSQFLFPYLIEQKRATAPGAVMDLGCGLGRNSVFFAEQGFHVFAFDIVPDNIQHLQQKQLTITAACQDITEKLLVANQSIDIAIDIFCYKHQVNPIRRKNYREELSRVLKDDGYYLLSFAGKEDGFYGPLLKESKDGCSIIDPFTQVGSVLFEPEDIAKEFEGYTIKKIQTVKKEGQMHGETYLRVTHALIMQKR